jgi:hypothetical protein
LTFCACLQSDGSQAPDAAMKSLLSEAAAKMQDVLHGVLTSLELSDEVSKHSVQIHLLWGLSLRILTSLHFTYLHFQYCLIWFFNINLSILIYQSHCSLHNAVSVQGTGRSDL